jgi:hypothetical protein
MNVSDLKQSKFLKKEDFETPQLVTISALTTQNVAKEGAEPDMKPVLHFHELDKPLVLNSTNGQLIAQITGKDENIEQSWVGARVVLYADPSISFGGKLVGGIRVRAPRPGAKLPPAQAAVAQHEPDAPAPADSDCPF